MNSTIDYPLSNEYMWYKMILELFKVKANQNDPLSYFMNQFLLRKDVFKSIYFFELSKEHSISLKEAFEVILNNNCELPDFPTSILNQVYQCDFVFDYDQSIEGAIFTEEKKALIRIEDFENIIKALDEAIVQSKNDCIEKPQEDDLDRKIKSFKYKKINTGLSNLTDLMNRLKEKELIAKDTGLATFRKVFSGEAIDQQVVWTGNISELSYFVRQLHNELKFVEYLKQEQWAVTINCFVDANGEKYKREKLRGQKTPASSGIIDTILNTLK